MTQQDNRAPDYRAEEVTERAREAGVHLVAFVWCDNAGVIRNKATHIDNLPDRFTSGIGFSAAMQAIRIMDVMEPVEGMGPVGEFRVVPDLSTFTLLPYAPKRALAIGDLVSLDGQPYGACPRTFLRRMIDRAADKGLRIVAAMEPEWTLATKEDGVYVGADESAAFSAIGMTAPLDTIDDIVSAMTGQGLRIGVVHPEAGHGQQEISLMHDEALTAADNQIIYRETVRNVAWRHGYYASFAPKPFAGQSGNGCHIHLSAWDADRKQNLFHAGDEPYALSKLGKNFLAGLMEHMPGLMALTAPSANSYRRFEEGYYAGVFNTYGPDNREAAVRIPSALTHDKAGTVNLEFKPSDSAANPYIALGGLIAAGLDGIDRELPLDENLNVDVDPASLPAAERKRRGIARLPGSLSDATAALEADQLLLDALGPTLATSYVAVRKGEARFFDGMDAQQETDLHFYRY
jgi:glutamine synthetase